MRKVIVCVCIFALAIITIAVIGCEPVESEQTQPPNVTVIVTSIYRFVDREAGVACWVSEYKGGISCLPLKETALEKGR